MKKLKNILMRIFGKLGALPTGRRYCCMCKSNIHNFLSYRGWRSLPPLMNALNVIGSDITQFSCPNCNCHDRERHLLLYLTKLGIIARFKGSVILHFAPEARLKKIIESQMPARYVKCDLYPNSADELKVDMLNIQFESEVFDFVIANHVLEHVSDDFKALTELHRVLKIGGMAILQTPYSNKLVSTFSDAGIDDDNSRLHAYGQEDHMRLYGSDIFSRFQSVGFASRVVTHESVLSDLNPIHYGVNLKEPFFLFERVL